jgi:succinate-semialdehyde dehydrogenase/glutarate-semialdehyde dehydrogenase
MDSSTSPLALLKDPSLLKTDALINGEWVGANSRFEVTDPATGQKLADVANHGPESAHHAIVAANKAWPIWRAKTAKERATILMKWFQLLQANADDLARLMTAEQGKPLAEAKGEVGYGASFLEWFAEEGKRVYGETIPTTDNNKRYLVIKQPIGVCAAITPWNFPIAMITRKVAPALAAGCPVVIKPAEQTPLSALAVAELAQRAGMPAGVLNILTADGANSIEIGKVLCSPTWCATCPSPAPPRSAASWPPSAPRRSRKSRWNWAAMRPSSCSTTPTWTARSKARWSASTATPARPACAPTASMCRTPCTTPSSPSWPRRPAR